MKTRPFDILVHGGLVVEAASIQRLDPGIGDGKIAAAGMRPTVSGSVLRKGDRSLLWV